MGEEVGLRLLELAVKEAPALADMLSRAMSGVPDDSSLADKVRALLPAEGAAARAQRALEAADRQG